MIYDEQPNRSSLVMQNYETALCALNTSINGMNPIRRLLWALLLPKNTRRMIEGVAYSAHVLKNGDPSDILDGVK